MVKFRLSKYYKVYRKENVTFKNRLNKDFKAVLIFVLPLSNFLLNFDNLTMIVEIVRGNQSSR